MDKTTLYGYFRAETSNGTGYVCVRLDRPPKTSVSTSYKASFAFCSPLDNFSRPLARRIADSRMQSNRIKGFVEFDFEKTEDTRLPELFKTALMHMYQNDINVPNWLREAKSTNFGRMKTGSKTSLRNKATVDLSGSTVDLSS